MSVHTKHRTASAQRSYAGRHAMLALVALFFTFELSTALAQSCPCDFTVSTRELSRDFYFCNRATFSGTGYDWAGARNLDIFKGAKGGKEPGSTKGVMGVKDFAPNTGDPQIGDHFCEIASGLRRNNGLFRKVERHAINTADEWGACIADLSNIALTVMAAGRDVIGDSCFDSGTGTPDKWETFPPPPLP